MSGLRLKYVATLTAGGTPDTGDPENWLDCTDGGIPWVNIADMTLAPRVTETARCVSPQAVAAKHLPIGKPGNTLFAMYASIGATAALGTPATWNQAILGIECVEYRADDRFMRYWLTALRPQLGALARSNTQDNLNAEQVGNLPFPSVDVIRQRAIADFLDAETKQLDHLMSMRRHMIELLDEKASGALKVAMQSRGFHFPSSLAPDWSAIRFPRGWRVAMLGVVLRELTNGYVGPTRDILRETGVPYVQSLHIKSGVIDFNRRPYYVDRNWHDERPRIHLRPSDVLIVQTGDIGQVAVVPNGLGEASCHALQIARVEPELLSGEFLGEYLRSPFGYHSLVSRTSGALHPHLEGSIRDIPIVLPPLSVQDEMLDEARSYRAPFAEAISVLERQMEMLTERRRALVTAAVTGQMSFPGAA
jgi:type I restriction enzyme, S subunit